MTSPLTFFDTTAQKIADLTGQIGTRVLIDSSALDRSESISLSPPGLWSANRSCRFIRTRDGWIAANLPREEDRAAIPALLEIPFGGDAWSLLTKHGRQRKSADIIERAELLGLAFTNVGETTPLNHSCAFKSRPCAHNKKSLVRVVDFSSLWAGPLCASIFAQMGADVIKIDSVERPDPTAEASPQFHLRLNGAKRRQEISLASQEERNALLEEIAGSDILVTNGRARALEQLGVTHDRLALINPDIIWIAVTGHGWRSNRIAFGDDAAAAGGLVGWDGGEPRFVGDALADPLTGLAAAATALEMLIQGRSAFIDASLASVAAFAAHRQRVPA